MPARSAPPHHYPVQTHFWSAPDQIVVLRERIGSGEMMRKWAVRWLISSWQHTAGFKYPSHGPEEIAKDRRHAGRQVSAQDGIILRP